MRERNHEPMGSITRSESGDGGAPDVFVRGGQRGEDPRRQDSRPKNRRMEDAGGHRRAKVVGRAAAWRALANGCDAAPALAVSGGWRGGRAWRVREAGKRRKRGR